MNITIDGKTCACESGEILLDIIKRNGITVPTLCDFDGLPGQGSCRICIVEVEQNDQRNIVASCVYPVENECAVLTSSDRVIRQRKMILSLLRARAPESEKIKLLCDEYGASQYERFIRMPEEKCIMCGLCAAACESLGTGAISTVNRGIDKKVTTPYDEPSMYCVACKSCAAVCPVDAIEVQEWDDKRTIWGKTSNLMPCKSCGKLMGTPMELKRAAAKIDAEIPDLCDKCRKKAIADAMVKTYGQSIY